MVVRLLRGCLLVWLVTAVWLGVAPAAGVSEGQLEATNAGVIFTVAGTGDHSFDIPTRPGLATASALDPSAVAGESRNAFFIGIGQQLWRVVDGRLVKRADLPIPISDIAALPNGDALVAGATAVFRVSRGGTATRVAGTDPTTPVVAPHLGDGGPATSATLEGAASVAPTADGGFLVADSAANRIRRVTSRGEITTIAGTGRAGHSGDGKRATRAHLEGPSGVSVTRDGGFLIAEVRHVRKVTAGGAISTVAGPGKEDEPRHGDSGPATQAEVYPRKVEALDDGAFLILDDYRIRRVDRRGIIATVAGSDSARSLGDGGPATEALLDGQDFAVTGDGGMLVAGYTYRVRYVAASTAALPALAFDHSASRVSPISSYVGARATRPGRIVLDVVQGQQHILRARTHARAGTDRIGLPGRRKPGVYLATARLVSAGHAIAEQREGMYLGGRLRLRDAERIIGDGGGSFFGGRIVGRVHAADTDPEYEVSSCHRFSRTRIDCKLLFADLFLSPTFECQSMESLQLERNGQLLERDYGCNKVRSRPRWKSANEVDLAQYARQAPRR